MLFYYKAAILITWHEYTRMGIKMQYILILEDDSDLAEGIQLALQGESLAFIICDTLAKARSEMKSKKIDLYILDINLSDGSGLELCKEIRKNCKTPTVLLTAKDMELDIVTGLESGADDYITKPFSLMVLRARIRALLRRTGNETEKKYNRGKFLFRFETMDFYNNGNSVELSKTEQRILYLLVFNEGQLLTRERLLEWVWPNGTEYVEDNALSVGIRRLRDKLEVQSSKPEHIKTVYGKGYIWEN